ncbi:hypothetical protein GN156_09390 [bacterium LRH843]|nr:hypothetical protein [bacterium LRH843]
MIHKGCRKLFALSVTFLLFFSLTTPTLAETIKEYNALISLESVYTDANRISPWAYDLIGEATGKSIVSGNAGKINPKENITRAEFAKLMVSVLGLDTTTEKVIQFTDVKESDWYYPYVNVAYKEKVVSGYSNNQFLPNQQITREEMATMIVRVLGIDHYQANVEIKDFHKVAPWAETAVKAIVSSHLMEGYDRHFQPKELATREMAIVVAMRAYHYDGNLNGEDDSNHDEDVSAKVDQLINKAAEFMQKMTPDPTISSLAGEWTILALARSGEHVPAAYYDKYYSNVVNEVTRLMPVTSSKPEGRLDRNKGTEHSRLILGLTSIGKDIHNVDGYDISEALADFDYVKTQGINGPIFALLAFDSQNYEIPIVDNVNVQTTRELLLEFILDREINGGGWALGVDPKEADPDITAMAIQGLTPYYDKRSDVKSAIDRGINWLSKVQDRNGGFHSWEALNLESTAQVIVALTGLGIDPHTDRRFVKNGNSALDALLSYAAPGGGFYHTKQGQVGNGGASPGEVDPMATDQAMYALVAYKRFIQSDYRLYDMTDSVRGVASPFFPFEVISA